MNGYIDECGQLFIERKFIYKGQDCKNKNKYCRDTCPLFGEPERMGGFDGRWYLIICEKRMLVFSEFKDRRKSELKGSSH